MYISLHVSPAKVTSVQGCSYHFVGDEFTDVELSFQPLVHSLLVVFLVFPPSTSWFVVIKFFFFYVSRVRSFHV